MSHQIQAAPEEMASFFDVRSDGYEDHMLNEVYKGKPEELYARVVSPISQVDVPIRILDLGCGTGLEVAYIFERAPQTHITCMDMSANMLELLQQKYVHYASQIECVQGSYVTETFASNEYDYAVSVMTMHHVLEDAKRELYRKIRDALKNGGLYIEGDYTADEAEEQKLLKEYYDAIQDLDPGHLYHLDIPFTVQRQERLLLEAGFKEVKTIYDVGSRAIFVAHK